MPGRLGVLFRPEWPPEDLPAFARDAESEGFAELWLVEDCFLTGGLTMAATALACTDALDVGIGLLPVALRNAALTAMEIAGLARIHPARLTVALGHGVEPWMRQIDARPPDRLAALEETVTAVRSLLAGEVVTMRGRHVSIEGVRLVHAPVTPPPILVGTTGPRGLELAGRTADGILLPEGSVPEAVRWARGEAGGKTDHRLRVAQRRRRPLRGCRRAPPGDTGVAGVRAVRRADRARQPRRPQRPTRGRPHTGSRGGR